MDKDITIKFAYEKGYSDGYKDGMSESKQTAQWMISSDGFYPYCSNCREEPKALTKFCPNCGRLMIGDRK